MRNFVNRILARFDLFITVCRKHDKIIGYGLVSLSGYNYEPAEKIIPPRAHY